MAQAGVLVAGRLRLAPVTESDEAWLWDLLARPEVRRYLLDDAVLPRNDVAAMIADSMASTSATAYWRISLGENDVGGIIGVRAPSRASLALRAIGWRSLEVVIALAPGLWGQGLAREAVEAVARHAGQDGVTFALVGCVDAPNERSCRLMRRCGFYELGRVNGPLYPLIVYERPL